MSSGDFLGFLNQLTPYSIILKRNKIILHQTQGIQTKVMQNKDKGDGIEDSPLDMLLVILLEGASKEVVMPSSHLLCYFSTYL